MSNTPESVDEIRHVPALTSFSEVSVAIQDLHDRLNSHENGPLLTDNDDDADAESESNSVKADPPPFMFDPYTGKPIEDKAEL